MIRKANDSDIKKINKLGEILHPGFTKLFHIETEINSNLAIVLVSEINNEVIGYLYALDFGDNIDLLSIFVDNNYRNKGIASNMLKELMKIGENKTITLEVSSDNMNALRLYEKHNFKTVGIRKNYYKNSDAIIMKRGII